MAEAKSTSKLEHSIEFQDVDKIMLPQICLVCGKKTDRVHNLSKLGRFNNITYETIHHHFSIPLCKKCKKVLIKKEAEQKKSRKRFGLFTALGVITAIIIGFLTYSFIFSITTFIILFLFPYSNYRVKYTSKHSLNLENFIQIEIEEYGKIIKFHFLNEKLKRLVEKANREGFKSSIDSIDQILAKPEKDKSYNEEMDIELEDFDLFKSKRKRPKKITKTIEFDSINRTNKKEDDN